LRKLYVVGLGPGDPSLITIKGVNAIKESDVIFVPYSTGSNRSLALSIISPYLKKDAKIITLGFPMAKRVNEEKLKEIGEIICENASSISSFVTLGDPTLYSTFFRISKFVDCVDKVEIIPGVSSVTACASKAFISLAQGDEGIAVVPSSRLDLIELSKGKFETIVVMKGNENLDLIAKLLSPLYTLIYARRCYLDGEKVMSWDEKSYDRDYFSMLIGVRKSEDG